MWSKYIYSWFDFACKKILLIVNLMDIFIVHFLCNQRDYCLSSWWVFFHISRGFFLFFHVLSCSFSSRNQMHTRVLDGIGAAAPTLFYKKLAIFAVVSRQTNSYKECKKIEICTHSSEILTRALLTYSFSFYIHSIAWNNS